MNSTITHSPDESSKICVTNTTNAVSHSTAFITGYQVYYGAFMGLIAFICLVGNTLVVRYIYGCQRGTYTACLLLIFSLACSDALQGLVYPFYNVIHLTYSGLAEEGCKWIVFMVCMPQNISAYNLVGVTIVRFLAVYKPHIYYQLLVDPCYKRLLALGIGLIWLWGTLSSAILYIFMYEENNREGGMCRYEMKFNFQHAFGGFLVTELCPGVVMIGFYTALICLYRKHTRGLHTQKANKKAMRTETQMAKTAGLLITVYMVTWTPLWVYIIVYTLCLESKCLTQCEAEIDMPYVRATARMLAFSNSAVNVFIYSGMNATFRKAVCADLRCVWSRLCMCYSCRDQQEITTSTPTGDIRETEEMVDGEEGDEKGEKQQEFEHTIM